MAKFYCPACNGWEGGLLTKTKVKCRTCGEERNVRGPGDPIVKAVEAPPRASCSFKEYLHDRQGGRCGICGYPLEMKDANLDHLIPVILGGESHRLNLRLTHHWCNTKRGADPLPMELELVLRLAMAQGSRAAAWVDVLPMPDWPART